MRQIVNIKQKSTKKCITMVNNNQEKSDPKLVADAFNKYFADIGKNLTKSIPNVPNSPFDYLGTSSVTSSFVLFPTTQYEIENEISSLKTGKAMGPYSIPIDIMQLLKSVISKPL
jgi:hypothetical protein